MGKKAYLLKSTSTWKDNLFALIEYSLSNTKLKLYIVFSECLFHTCQSVTLQYVLVLFTCNFPKEKYANSCEWLLFVCKLCWILPRERKDVRNMHDSWFFVSACVSNAWTALMHWVFQAQEKVWLGVRAMHNEFSKRVINFLVKFSIGS